MKCKYCEIKIEGAKQKRYCSIKCREAARYLRRREFILIKKKEYYEQNKEVINKKKTYFYEMGS